MSELIERFLKYVAYDTQSSETSGEHPSTPGQRVLAERIAADLKAIGVADVFVSEGAYVYATIPASKGREAEPALGFLAHLDTSPDASGKDVKPSIVKYEGGILPLGNSGRVLDPAMFPALNRFVGEELIVTDGTTLLGADDKIGDAIMVTLAAELTGPNAPAHREIRLCFTPDEEIGEGTRGFDPVRFGAKRAYTVDGGDVSGVENATFNAALAKFSVRGVSVHPGSAKDVMVNAIKVAAEILAALPPQESPERTSGREGFFHPCHISGEVGSATLEMLVRDHDAQRFAERKRLLERIAADFAARYPTAEIKVAIRDQYYNMEAGLAAAPELVENALAAIRAEGLEPRVRAVRGGTDGAALTRMGIPCPNLGTGGRNYHGETEYAVVREMECAYRIVKRLATE